MQHLLCDRNWNMEKIFYSSGLELRKGDSLAEWLPEAEETGRKLEGENSGQVLLFWNVRMAERYPFSSSSIPPMCWLYWDGRMKEISFLLKKPS